MNRVSIGFDNSLSPIRRQAVIETNAEKLPIDPIGTNFIEILIKIQKCLFMKMHMKVSSANRRPFCPGADQLTVFRASDLWGHYAKQRAVGLPRVGWYIMRLDRPDSGVAMKTPTDPFTRPITEIFIFIYVCNCPEYWNGQKYQPVVYTNRLHALFAGRF